MASPGAAGYRQSCSASGGKHRGPRRPTAAVRHLYHTLLLPFPLPPAVLCAPQTPRGGRHPGRELAIPSHPPCPWEGEGDAPCLWKIWECQASAVPVGEHWQRPVPAATHPHLGPASSRSARRPQSPSLLALSGVQSPWLDVSHTINKFTLLSRWLFLGGACSPRHASRRFIALYWSGA